MRLERDRDHRWPSGWYILPGVIVGFLVWRLIVRAFMGGGS